MFKKTTFISVCKWVAMIATSIATALATISCSVDSWKTFTGAIRKP